MGLINGCSLSEELLMHVALEKEHLKKVKFTIHKEGHPLNGTKFYGEYSTEIYQSYGDIKEYGKMEVMYWLSDDLTSFLTMEDVIKYFDLWED